MDNVPFFRRFSYRRASLRRSCKTSGIQYCSAKGNNFLQDLRMDVIEGLHYLHSKCLPWWSGGLLVAPETRVVTVSHATRIAAQSPNRVLPHTESSKVSKKEVVKEPCKLNNNVNKRLVESTCVDGFYSGLKDCDNTLVTILSDEFNVCKKIVN